MKLTGKQKENLCQIEFLKTVIFRRPFFSTFLTQMNDFFFRTENLLYMDRRRIFSANITKHFAPEHILRSRRTA